MLKTYSEFRPDPLQAEFDIPQYFARRFPIIELLQKFHGFLVQFALDVLFFQKTSHSKR